MHPQPVQPCEETRLVMWDCCGSVEGWEDVLFLLIIILNLLISIILLKGFLIQITKLINLFVFIKKKIKKPVGLKNSKVMTEGCGVWCISHFFSNVT